MSPSGLRRLLCAIPLRPAPPTRAARAAAAGRAGLISSRQSACRQNLSCVLPLLPIFCITMQAAGGFRLSVRIVAEGGEESNFRVRIFARAEAQYLKAEPALLTPAVQRLQKVDRAVRAQNARPQGERLF